MRCRNPWFLARLRLFGWKVRFTLAPGSRVSLSGPSQARGRVGPKPNGGPSALVRQFSTCPLHTAVGGWYRPRPADNSTVEIAPLPQSQLTRPRVARAEATRCWRFIPSCGTTCGCWAQHNKGEAANVPNDEVWDLFCTRLRKATSDAAFFSSFDTMRPVEIDDQEMVIAVPNSMVQRRIEDRWLALMGTILADITGKPQAIRIVREDHNGNGSSDHIGAVSTGEGVTPLSLPGAVAANGTTNDAVPLHHRFSFENFVIGGSNRLAHAAAMAVAETPGTSYNPLCIHGDSGLGKTHLLRAVENYVRDHFPTRQVRYVSAETLFNELVDAIGRQTTQDLKRRWRAYDVLLVDDIQFMEGKETAQQEFFYTYEALHQFSRQIVITSDRHPKFLEVMDRLKNRFLSGLTTPVEPPDLETRLAILRTKSRASAIDIPDDILTLIAERVTDNIRSLEGALTRVWAYGSLSQEPFTLELAERILADLLRVDQPRQITPAMIIDATCEQFGVSRDELCGPSRRRHLVTARQIAMYVFRQVTDASYPAIAKEFGGRDHTTVIHAVAKIEALMKERRTIYDQVTELIQRVKKTGG
ncbi:MAG TPA: chromosomal replication initiator protein DnaA [Acidimicrobiales bacterium]|nr:chromosomal replication initiator protein DnaA [Acidimicrobiales bacterium]